MTQVLLASRNPAKLAELHRILGAALGSGSDASAAAGSDAPAAGAGIEVLGLDDIAPYDEPPETEPTFEGNALIKARAGLAATGIATLADDSGLCVDALNGMPGVLSARWAGPARDDDANNRLVLEQLRDVPEDRRGGEFRCAVAFCTPSGVEEVAFGEMRGSITRAPRGSGGFGYDVIFVPDGDTRTTAELDSDAKDAISHRGRALREIAPTVVAALGAGAE